ncbi:MAG: hypothetical protein EA419_03255 [Wenzhouxiangella sp.]|nr:MAG: hypothetical protein EA419_03255 [Wenzhouxiangella sp.]
MHRFPALIFVLSFVGVAVSLWLSRSFDLVPDCRVFIDGCISISASGRQEPAVFVFRATIIPTGMLLIVTWWLNVQWLRLLGLRRRLPAVVLHVLGTASPVLLICYIALIGSAGEIDHAIRQAVITTYFPATLVAKIILAILLMRLRPDGLPAWLPRVMLVIAVVVLGLAVNSVVVAALMDDPSVVHNLTQWHGTTAFAAWYLLLARAWGQTGFDLRLLLAPDR